MRSREGTRRCRTVVVLRRRVLEAHYPMARITLPRYAALVAPDLLERLRAALAGGPPLRLALCFGSAARGQSRPDSDIDVGILPVDPDLSLRAELDLAVTLERAAGRPIDLVRLDRSDVLLRFRAARDGIVVRAEPPVEEARFRAATCIEHDDLGPLIREGMRRYRAARRGGFTRGQ